MQAQKSKGRSRAGDDDHAHVLAERDELTSALRDVVEALSMLADASGEEPTPAYRAHAIRHACSLLPRLEGVLEAVSK